jgi:hypothetical protein
MNNLKMLKLIVLINQVQNQISIEKKLYDKEVQKELERLTELLEKMNNE